MHEFLHDIPIAQQARKPTVGGISGQNVESRVPPEVESVAPVAPFTPGGDRVGNKLAVGDDVVGGDVVFVVTKYVGIGDEATEGDEETVGGSGTFMGRDGEGDG